MKLKSTLDGFVVNTQWVSGNSTLLADKAIQMIFTQGGCIVQDHYKEGKSAEANKGLFVRVLQRLNNEHRLNTDIFNGEIEIDVNKLIIKKV